MHLGAGEIALLLILALVLFGAKRLPQVGRAAGEAIREFKSAFSGGGSQNGGPHGSGSQGGSTIGGGNPPAGDSGSVERVD
jgi:sec-independent protein translocase protein TatA